MPAAGVGRQQHGDLGDVLDLAQALGGRLLGEPVEQLLIGHAHRLGGLRARLGHDVGLDARRGTAR